MKRIGRHIVISILVAWFTFPATMSAQQDLFYAAVNKNAVKVGEQLKVDFTIVSLPHENFQPPSFDYFESFHNGIMSDIRIVNGRTTRSIVISYILRPRKEGSLAIGPARLEVNGKEYKTNPITIEVSSSSAEVEEKPENVYLTASINKRQAYKGEELIVTYKLYINRRLGIDDYTIPTSSYSGFWKQELKLGNQSVKQEVVNGIAYRTLIIQRVALFPQVTGPITIEAPSIEAVIAFSFFERRRVRIAGNALQVEVLPLPEADMPKGFSGNVGKYDLTSELNVTQVTADNPLTYRIRISGEGNLRLVEAPVIEVPPDFELYDPKVIENISYKGSVRGSKEFEYLIIPRRQGTYKIAPVLFSFFDPEKKTFTTLATPEYDIDVSKGTGESIEGGVSGLTKEEVELIGEDIRFIKTGPPAFITPGQTFFTSWGYYLMLASPFFLLIPILLLRRRVRQQKGDFDVLARKEASRAVKKLSQIKPDGDDAFKTIGESLLQYAEKRFRLSRANLSKESIGKELVERGVDKEIADELFTLIEKCEVAAYAPSNETNLPSNVIGSAKSIIRAIEKTI